MSICCFLFQIVCQIVLFFLFFNFIVLSDVDECSKGSHDCDVNASCNNTIGSYQCVCKPTYYGNGKNCTYYRESFNESIFLTL